MAHTTQVKMDDKFDPLRVLASAFAISSLGGLASLLQSDKQLSVRSVLAAVLYSGVTGLIIALIWYTNYRNDNLYFLLGVSGLAGVGGTTMIDFAIQAVKKGGLNISIDSPGGKKPDDS